jgi:hypothetical protein
MAPPKRDPQSRRLQQEKEANAFAAELLMPERMLRQAIHHGKPRLELIQELAQQFQVSWLAMAYRYLEVVSEPCLLILRPPGAEPTLLRTPTFRRAGAIEVLDPLGGGDRLSQWVKFTSDARSDGEAVGTRDSMVQWQSETQAQTGTRIDLLWAPEFSTTSAPS